MAAASARTESQARGKGAAKPRPRDAEVLKVAATVFARSGYAAATVQDVADELGMLKGSIYYYIKTKEDLLHRLLLEVHADVDELLSEVSAIDGLNPLEGIAHYVRRQATFNLQNLVRISVYYNDIDQLSDERRREILKLRKKHDDYVMGLVLEGQRQGLIDPTQDARLLTYHAFAVLIWPYRWFKPRGRVKVEDAVETCVAFVVGGLAKR